MSNLRRWVFYPLVPTNVALLTFPVYTQTSENTSNGSETTLLYCTTNKKGEMKPMQNLNLDLLLAISV